jgi:hypothetical protein
MLVAQALGEYGALSALSAGIQNGLIRLEETAGEWGIEGIVIAVVAIVLWRVLTAVR